MTGHFSFSRSVQAWPTTTKILCGLVGLMFLGFVCGMAVAGGRAWILWWQTRDWVETTATIQAIETEAFTDRPNNGACVVVEFTCLWQGREFTGRRLVAVPGFWGRQFGSMESAQVLSNAQKEGRPVPCLVNSNSPEQVYLFGYVTTEQRFGPLVGGSLFLILGGGLAGFSAYGFISRLQWRRRRRASPREPWKWYSDWSEGRLKPCNLGKDVGLYWVAVFWGGLAFLFTVFGIPGLLKEGPLWGVVLIVGFDLLAVTTLVTAITRSLRARRFAGSRLVLDQTPVWLGGGLNGVLVISGFLGRLTDLRATLECISWQLHGNSLMPSILWAGRHRLPTQDPDFGQTELRLPLHLAIPEECPERSDIRPYDRVEWMLTVRASTPGPDLELCFEIPVFRRRKGA